MIGVIGFSDLHVMPFTLKYTNYFDEIGMTEYEVIFWNRSGIQYNKGFRGKAISYDVPLNTYLPFSRKILGFLGYTRFVKRVIKSRKYDKLIVLTSQTAVPLFSTLLRFYRNNYIYDYRDITKEYKSKLYRLLVIKLIQHSKYTMMSSLGFLNALQIKNNCNIILAHNTREVENASTYSLRKNPIDPIRIVFWGMVRQPEYNRIICDRFGNDPRFVLTYHGEGYFKDIQEYCAEKGYRNIFFTGRYELAEIPAFVEDTDILHCIYDFESDIKMKDALQVKMYDAIKYRIPILIRTGSYTAQYTMDYHFGLQVNPASQINLADLVYDWYRNIDAHTMEQGFQELEKKIYNDDLIFQECLSKFIKE